MQNVMHIMMGGYDDGRANPVQQYDVNSREFVCHLWERPGVMYQMAEDAVVGAVFEWRRNPPSKEYETKILNRSTVVVKVPSAATQLTGTVKLQLKIHQGGGVLHSPKIAFAVLESLQASDTETDEPALLLEALVERAAYAIESAENAAQAAEDAAEKLPDDLAEEVGNGIKAHDESENAHVDMRKKLKELEGGVVTAAEKEAWNAKSNFSGKYADLDGKPEIPTKLPNPAKVVFTGGAEGEYDGSEELVLDIPDDVVVIKLDWEGEHSTSSHTYAQITDALAKEKTILLANVTGVYHYTGTEGANYVFTMLRYQQNAASEQPGVYVSKITIDEANNVTRTEYEIADTPSPEKLKFTGAANGEYDGSEEVTVNIPDAPVKSVNGQMGDVVLEDVFIVKADGMRINGAFVASTASKNAAEIRAAVADGKTCLMVDAEGAVLPYIGEVVYQIGKTNPAFARSLPINYHPNKWSFSYLYVEDDAKINTVYDGNIRMPSPEKLTFTGAVDATYDGGEAVTVEIPQLSKYAQPDWGAETGEPVEVYSGTLLAADVMDGLGWMFQPMIALVAGQTYIVNWNGTEYKCTAIGIEDMTAIGNLYLLDHSMDDTGELFGIVVTPVEEATIVMPANPAEDVALTITQQPVTIHQIPAKYVETAAKETITISWESGTAITCDTPFETAWAMEANELAAAINIVAQIGESTLFNSARVTKEELGGIQIIAILVDVLGADTRDNTTHKTAMFTWLYDNTFRYTEIAHMPLNPPDADNDTNTAYLKRLVGEWRMVSANTLRNDILIPATADTLGAVKVGDGLTVDENGVLSVQPSCECYGAGDVLWEDYSLSLSDGDIIPVDVSGYSYVEVTFRMAANVLTSAAYSKSGMIVGVDAGVLSACVLEYQSQNIYAVNTYMPYIDGEGFQYRSVFNRELLYAFASGSFTASINSGNAPCYPVRIVAYE